MHRLDVRIMRTPSGPVALSVGFDASAHANPDEALEERRADVIVVRVPHDRRSLVVARRMLWRARLPSTVLAELPTNALPTTHAVLRLVAVYASDRPWPAYLTWDKPDHVFSTGSPCAYARVLCSRSALCMCRHEAAFVVDPRTLYMHVRLLRTHPPAGSPLRATHVDAWTVMAFRSVMLSPDAEETLSMHDSWLQTLRRPYLRGFPELGLRGEDPHAFAVRKAFAVFVVGAQGWWLRAQGNGSAVYDSRELCARTTSATLRLFARDVRRATGARREHVARLGCTAAAHLVKAMCYAPGAPCHPWLRLLAKRLRACVPRTCAH